MSHYQFKGWCTRCKDITDWYAWDYGVKYIYGCQNCSWKQEEKPAEVREQLNEQREGRDNTRAK